MKINRKNHVFKAIICGMSFLHSFSLNAQSASQTLPSAPEFAQTDDNGVDLFSGNSSKILNLGSIGSGNSKLDYTEFWNSGGLQNSLSGFIDVSVNDVNLNVEAMVHDGGYSKKFIKIKDLNSIMPNSIIGLYVQAYGKFESLIISSDGTSWVLTKSNGEKLHFGSPPGVSASGFCSASTLACGSLLLDRTLPNGVRVDYTWDVNGSLVRPLSVSNNLGSKIVLSYGFPNSWSSITPYALIQQQFVSRVDFFNLAKSKTPLFSINRYLNGYGNVYLGNSWQDVTIVTPSGSQWRLYGDNAFGVEMIKTPDSQDFNITFNSGTAEKKVNNRGVVSSYSLSSSAGPQGTANVGTMTKVTADGAVWKYNFNIMRSKVIYIPDISSFVDPNGNETYYDSKASVINKITFPEGNSKRFYYDARTNLTSIYEDPKAGVNAPAMSRSYVYSTDCLNSITCNLPTSETDNRGNSVVYTYDSTHGGILTETSPSVKGIAPVKRYHYAQRYAWVLNGSGGYSQAASPVWLRTEERTCQTSATIGDACQGGSSDEVITTYDYGPDSGPNNLLLRGVVVTIGSQSLRTCYTYDARGNKLSETKPLGTGGGCP